jgi:hypothetical protein
MSAEERLQAVGISGFVMASIAGCATADVGSEPVYHGYAVVVEKGVPPIRNLRYVLLAALPFEASGIPSKGTGLTADQAFSTTRLLPGWWRRCVSVDLKRRHR